MTEVLPNDMRSYAIKLCVILRLSVLLHRSRSTKPVPEIEADATDNSVRLVFPDEWLEEHPLTRADLKTERKHLATFNVRLEYA